MALRGVSITSVSIPASSITGNLSPSNGGKPTNRFTNFTNTSTFPITTNTLVMGGFGGTWKLTPASTGNVRFRMTGYVTSTLPTTAVYDGRYSTGVAPTQGGTLAGTIGNTTDYVQTLILGEFKEITIEYEATGLTTTAYWFDIAARTSGGGTATFTPISVIIEEF